MPPLYEASVSRAGRLGGPDKVLRNHEGGMQTFNHALLQFLEFERISERIAMKVSPDP